MLKKLGIVITIVLLAALTLASTPPTDPDGEVVFMPQGPTGPVYIGKIGDVDDMYTYAEEIRGRLLSMAREADGQ